MRFLLCTFFILLLSTNTFQKSVNSVRRHVESRIIGGQLARAGEFPYSAAIYITTSDGRYFCGGSLISNEWILTAAQCVDGATSFTIILGSNNLQGSDSNRVTVATDEYYAHPSYDPETYHNDIAVIKLRMAVELSDYIQPIELPTAALSDHSVVVAIGWGQTSDEDSATIDELYRVSITALTNEECRLTYGNDQITDEMVCAEGNYNQGTCHGDSGSPLIRYELNQEATVVAVSSFFSGNGCESTDPSGFTRTFPYLEWIRNVTEIL